MRKSKPGYFYFVRFPYHGLRSFPRRGDWGGAFKINRLNDLLTPILPFPRRA